MPRTDWGARTCPTWHAGGTSFAASPCSSESCPPALRVPAPDRGPGSAAVGLQRRQQLGVSPCIYWEYIVTYLILTRDWKYSLIDLLHVEDEIALAGEQARIRAQQGQGPRRDQSPLAPVLVVPGEVQVDGQHQQVQQDQGQRCQDVHVSAFRVAARAFGSRPVLIDRTEVEAESLRHHRCPESDGKSIDAES